MPEWMVTSLFDAQVSELVEMPSDPPDLSAVVRCRCCRRLVSLSAANRRNRLTPTSFFESDV
jgi:hypothetical protein